MSRIARSSSSRSASIARKSSGSSAVFFSVTATGARVPWPRARDDLDRARAAADGLGRGGGGRDDAAREGGGGRRRRDARRSRLRRRARAAVEHRRAAAARVARLRRPGGRAREDVPRDRAVAGGLRSTEAPPRRSRAGRDTAAALRREGVHATFAPVLDLADGPLGSRQFAKPEYGVAFARGLGSAACAKHFPGLGSTPKSTDVARVYGVLRTQDLAPFRAAIRAGVPCVMVGHAIYPRLGPRRASFEPKTYELLRGLGFRGVAITDSLGVLGSPYAPFWARLALRAGADLVLTTSARDARRIVDALVPLAARRRARRQARPDQPVPPLGGGTTVTVTVASTVLPFAPTARAVSRCGPGGSASASSRTCTAPRRRCPAATPSTRNSTRSARPRDVDAPDDEARHLLALRDASGRRSRAAASAGGFGFGFGGGLHDQRDPPLSPCGRRSRWRPLRARAGRARARFVLHEKRNGGRRSTARRLPSTVNTILAAFWPHGRTRSRIVLGASIHGRAPALVSAKVLLSTTTRSPSTS